MIGNHQLVEAEIIRLKEMVEDKLALVHATVSIEAPTKTECSSVDGQGKKRQWVCYSYEVNISGDFGVVIIPHWFQEIDNFEERIPNYAWYFAYEYWSQKDGSFNTGLGKTIFPGE